MEPTKRAYELTKCNNVTSISPRVGSAEFTDIALGNHFIPYYSGGEFGKKEVNLGKGDKFRKKEVSSG